MPGVTTPHWTMSARLRSQDWGRHHSSWGRPSGGKTRDQRPETNSQNKYYLILSNQNCQLIKVAPEDRQDSRWVIPHIWMFPLTKVNCYSDASTSLSASRFVTLSTPRFWIMQWGTNWWIESVMPRIIEFWWRKNLHHLAWIVHQSQDF